MENRINIAKLLKNCPTGMELDCTMFDNVTFVGISNRRTIVAIRRTVNHKLYLDKYGCPLEHPKEDLKCVIFPKGKTTWEGFIPPCKFKDGDVVSNQNNIGTWIGIYHRHDSSNETFSSYCSIGRDGKFCANSDNGHGCYKTRLATEEEKAKLFQAIKDNGYKWNTENKTLEKVEPRFHKGDWVVFNNQPEKGSIYQVKDTHNYEYTLQHILGGSMPLSFSSENMLRLWTINDAKDGDVLVSRSPFIYSKQGSYGGINWYTNKFIKASNFIFTDSPVQPATKEQCNILFQKIKEAGYKWNPETKTLEKLPKFKVGNRIKNKTDKWLAKRTIKSYDKNIGYFTTINDWVRIEDQDNWELVPDKFNINTLIPFESKVLVRHNKDNKWTGSFFSFIDRDLHSHCYKFVTTADKSYPMMIPFKGNEHLLGKTDDCQDFYKTWE